MYMFLNNFTSVRNNLTLFGCAVILCMWLPGVVPAVGADAEWRIDWQVNHPFRLFQRKDLLADHRQALAEFNRLKQDASAADVDEHGYLKMGTEWVGPILFAQRKLAGEGTGPESGWAATTLVRREGRRGNIDNTCWNWRQRTLSSACKTSFLFPEEVSIEMRLAGGDGAGLVCDWEIAMASNPQFLSLPKGVSCTEPVAATNIAVDQTHRLRVKIWRSRARRDLVSEVTSPLRARHAVILGLGESYAAGESNPDRPAYFRNPLRITREGQPPAADREPLWMDWPCHRSLYSHQLRVALQLSLEDTHRVVTYIGYGCSGAVVANVMTGFDPRKDYPDPVDRIKIRNLFCANTTCTKTQKAIIKTVVAQSRWSQIDLAIRDLCAKPDLRNRRGATDLTCERFKKNVDLVLLSIGGNDAGFGKLVRWTMLQKRKLLTRWAERFNKVVPPEKFKEGFDILEARYKKLSDKLKSRLPLTSEGGLPATNRVLLAPYPTPFWAEDGQWCRLDSQDRGAMNDGMNVEATLLKTTNDALQRLKSVFIDGLLSKIMKEAADKAQWIYSDLLLKKGSFRSHGICAVNSSASGDKNSPEKLKMPLRCQVRKGTDPACNIVARPRLGWRIFDPRRLKGHAPRQRWYRTFNDSMLIQYKSEPQASSSDRPFNRVTFSAISGVFHPSSEGQAAIADSLMPGAREILRKFGGK